MLRKEIEKIYSNIIADYFNKGYYINMNTMNGSQLNEIAKIDLTNGKEVLRVMLCGSNVDRNNECNMEIFIAWLALAILFVIKEMGY